MHELFYDHPASASAATWLVDTTNSNLTSRPNERRVDVIAAPKAVDVNGCRRTVRDRHYTTGTAATMVRRESDRGAMRREPSANGVHVSQDHGLQRTPLPRRVDA